MIKQRMMSVLQMPDASCEDPTTHSRQGRGETLSETLVGLLIAGLSIIMMSTAIATASQLVVKTREMAETYESSTRALAPGAGSKTGSVLISGDGNFGESYESASGDTVSVTYEESDLPGSIKGVTYSQMPSSS